VIGTGLQRLLDGKFTFNHIASVPIQEHSVLDENEPVQTITTQNTNSFAHPRNHNRTLSIRELARLFSYPDWEQFFGSTTAMRRQIGNSVPVKLAKAVALPIVAVHRALAETWASASNDGDASAMSRLFHVN